jgi:hypothetical protein
VVESQPSKLLVAGSIPVSRSILRSGSPAKDAHRSSGGCRRAKAGRAEAGVSYGWPAILRSGSPAKAAHRSSGGCVERRWADGSGTRDFCVRLCGVEQQSRLGLVRRTGAADLSAEVPGSEAAGAKADVAQLAERVLGKDEVTSSILVIGSILRSGSPAKDAHRSSRECGRAKVGRL